MKYSGLLIGLIGTALVAGCVQPHGQKEIAQRDWFTRAEVASDATSLRDAVIQRHPKFYNRQKDLVIDASLSRIVRDLPSRMTRKEAFRAIARMNPSFRDAHTFLSPIPEEEQLGQKFPLSVGLNNRGELLVKGDWVSKDGRDRIGSGAVLRLINGQRVSELLKELEHYGHGETEELRRHMLTVLFAHWLSAAKGWGNRFEIELQEGLSVRSVSIDGNMWKSDEAGGVSDAPTLSNLGGRKWLLRLPTFDIDDDPDGYVDAVARAFSTLRKGRATDLIIDVRGNTGGQSDAGAQVIRYLAQNPINQVSRARERLNDSNRGILGYKGRAGDMREMDLSRDGLVEPAPEDERFKGRVVLLIDEMTYSAGILFATTLQDHGLAHLVGRPTGGYANQTGNMEEFTLPITGLKAFIPARIFVRPNGNSKPGPVVPDIVAEENGLSGDRALDLALQHIGEPRDAGASKTKCVSSKSPDITVRCRFMPMGAVGPVFRPKSGYAQEFEF